jgi:hypothetical protein
VVGADEHVAELQMLVKKMADGGQLDPATGRTRVDLSADTPAGSHISPPLRSTKAITGYWDFLYVK